MNHSKKPNVAGENEPCLNKSENTPKTANVDANKYSLEYTPKLTFNNKVKKHVRENLLLVLTICSIFLGIAVGFIGRINRPSDTMLVLLSFPGEMLLRVLKMLILPLIISSLITGLAQLDPKSSGKMGTRALFFYVFTTFVATITGITMALLIRPGRKKIHREEQVRIAGDSISTLDALLDIIRNMFPENIVQACSKSLTTVYKKSYVPKKVDSTTTAAAVSAAAGTVLDNVTNSSVELVEKVVRELKYIDGTNVMGLVVFCIIFGIFISHSKSEAQILYDFFYVMNELIMKIISLIMWYAPVGILFLVSTNIMKIDNMAETASRLSIYMITVIIGLIIHSMITFQLLYFFITRKNPFRFLKGMLQAWLTAIGTASSSATLPITFRCLEENNKVDKRITRFMLPLGATINMDGTALYQCVATIFIAQLNGINLTLGHLLAISMASTATSIGVASVPSASLVTLLIILGSLGLPTQDMSYIITVDWLLDRLRTSINVLGDAYGCAIVEHLSRHELKKLDEEAEHEFAQIIAKQQQLAQPEDESLGICVVSGVASGGASTGGGLLTTCSPKENLSIFDETSAQPRLSSNSAQRLPISSSSIAAGGCGPNQFSEYRSFDRRPSNRSQLSISHHNQLDNVSAPPAPAISSQQLLVQPPSIVVMDALRRRSRALLFTNNKIPSSVNSMPQISNYQSNNASINTTPNPLPFSTTHGVNQDSNV